MKCYYIASVGGRTVLELREVPVPVPKRGEILVRVRAASLNRGELLASIRLHAADVPHPAGGDCAGDVQAVGDGVAAFRLGDRVLGRVRGSFTEYVAMPVDEAAPVPRVYRQTTADARSSPLRELTRSIVPSKKKAVSRRGANPQRGRRDRLRADRLASELRDGRAGDVLVLL
jgi:NADPH:quinone reductase-like Zn-dependent oxidoreductase